MTLKHSWLSTLVLALALTTSTGMGAFQVGDGNLKLPSAPLTAQELAARIDGYMAPGMVLRGIEPAPLADDAEFLRRVYLDLAGRIPTETEARAFLADTYWDRRPKLVDALLANPHHVRHMANTWQEVMTRAGGEIFASNRPVFRNWLEQQVRDNAPYDKMVRDLLTAPLLNPVGCIEIEFLLDKSFGGSNPNFNFNPSPNVELNPNIKLLVPNPKIDFSPNKVKVKSPPSSLNPALVQTQVSSAPGAFFFEANEYKAENLAATVSRQFLGVRLECAQCHNHPRGTWTRKQFWEFAAFFADAQPQQVHYGKKTNDLIDLASGQPNSRPAAKHSLAIPGTDKVAEARFLDGQSPKWAENKDSRLVLAEWLTAPSNPYFARTAVNRLWAHFFGIGIIDPIDDEPTAENPSSHPELLAELTKQFVAHQYDVKYLIRAITASKTYQRTSATTQSSQNEPRLYARMAVKGMSPDQLFDSLALATGYQDPAGVQPGIIVPNTPRGDFLLLFSSRDRKTETQTSILQALTLMNGKLIADATSMMASPKLAALLTGPATNAEKIEKLYLTTLSRLPRPEEAARLLRYVDDAGSESDARAALADVFWVLLNSSEFRFNH